MILNANPKAQYEAHKAEIDAALATALESGFYILGEQVRSFEREFAEYVGVEHGVGVGSGTEALHLALIGLGIGAGDEVITVSHTAVATVSAIELAGATPVFVDIDPVTYVLRPELVAAAITSKTKAIIAVHLYGHPAPISDLESVIDGRKVHIIEDCAQAHGAMLGSRRVGSMGTVACFSFYPTKNLGALGDGGMVVTQDARLAKRMRALREYGWEQRYVSAVSGWNTRLDELQAAVLRVKLKYLDADNAARIERAELYRRALGDTSLVLPVLRGGGRHVFHLYVVRHARRDEFLAKLRERGIGALIHYPVPIHLQPAYAGRVRGADALPETERAAREIVSLPMYPEFPLSDLAEVVSSVRASL